MSAIFYVFVIPFIISLFLFSRHVWTKEFLSNKLAVLAIIALLAVTLGCILLVIGILEGWFQVHWSID